jgi:hypothetical protein
MYFVQRIDRTIVGITKGIVGAGSSKQPSNPIDEYIPALAHLHGAVRLKTEEVSCP